MGQRLGIASALLGDPEMLMLDEPVNGLDPEGILWVRNLLTALAAEGRTVFVSSPPDERDGSDCDRDLSSIGRGRLIAAGPVNEVIRGASATTVLVRSEEPARLLAALTAAGHRAEATGGDAVRVSGNDSRAVGRVAATKGDADRAHAADGDAGGGVHGHDSRFGRVPRRAAW